MQSDLHAGINRYVAAVGSKGTDERTKTAAERESDRKHAIQSAQRDMVHQVGAALRDNTKSQITSGPQGLAL